MGRFYSIVKIIYYILTVFVGVFFLRGELLFGNYYTTLLEYAIPGYLVFCGVMIGYIISKLATINNNDLNTHHAVQMRSFVIGLVIGVLLALLYIFLR